MVSKSGKWLSRVGSWTRRVGRLDWHALAQSGRDLDQARGSTQGQSMRAWGEWRGDINARVG
jgi:hypothetical protein